MVPPRRPLRLRPGAPQPHPAPASRPPTATPPGASATAPPVWERGRTVTLGAKNYEIVRIPHGDVVASRYIGQCGADYFEIRHAGAATARLLRREMSHISQLASTATGENVQPSRQGDVVAHYARYLPRACEQHDVSDGSLVWIRPYQRVRHSLVEIGERHPNGLDAYQVGWIFSRMLEVLGYAHSRGLTHAAVLPEHLYYGHSNKSLMIYGWGCAAAPGARLTAVVESRRQFYPPEILDGSGRTGAAVDIYMAAKCALYAAPHLTHGAVKGALESCLLASPRMRPGDAWTLCADFKRAVEREHGPIEFATLEM